jgi:Lrp/AsnC family transcriptional regulator, leucine-responsive regulatory protein
MDWRILDALQEDSRQSFSKLGRRIGLSAPAVAERVRRMEGAGIITGYRVSIAMDKLGYAVTAIIRASAPEENCNRQEHDPEKCAAVFGKVMLRQ